MAGGAQLEKQRAARRVSRERLGERPEHDTLGREVCQNVWAYGYFVHECGQDSDHHGACRCYSCGRYFHPETCTPLHRLMLYGIQHTTTLLRGARATYVPPTHDSLEPPPASETPALQPGAAKPRKPRAPARTRGMPMTSTHRAALTLNEPWRCACGFTTTWKPGVGRHTSTCTKTRIPARKERAEA